MNSKAKVLIERINTVNAEVIRVAEGCSDRQWQMPVVEGDGRPVGVVFHHIAIAYPFTVNWVQMIANGEMPPPMTMEELNELNVQHAEEHANTPRAKTVAYLRQVTTETAAKLETFSDEQLDCVAPIVMAGGKEYSAEWLMEAFCIDHAESHLTAIRATLG